MTINNKRASILLMCFFVIISLTIIGAAFGILMVNESLSFRHNLQGVQAVYLAEAGLGKAIYDLRQDYLQSENWNDGNINGISVVPVADQFYVLYPSVSFGVGQYYTVGIMNDGSAKNKIWVKSTGTVGLASKTIQAYITVPLGGSVLSVTGWQIVNS